MEDMTNGKVRRDVRIRELEEDVLRKNNLIKILKEENKHLKKQQEEVLKILDADNDFKKYLNRRFGENSPAVNEYKRGCELTKTDAEEFENYLKTRL